MPEQTDYTGLVTILLIIIGVFVVFPMFFLGFVMMGSGPIMGGMWGTGTMPGWMFIVGILIQLLFLTTIIGGSYLIYRVVAGSESDSNQALERDMGSRED